uniref:uncharacterized protein LOC120330149 n=1 Tax=Styela clava TaxID=7725 RepID=UPI001939F844|nr:uncharacterized protein LOC120330149 [Styela clava]XP_039252930.1 uncharacterized protein LOC120330149 [Styela clava]XP_039252931.1 uncharacterized protein LOC120330149 [Styela clava]XP_039252932.1 uncharacterized protein LOC120330149 [Styela clava]XP_039252933.1 uncharacterized protein LOC120330149 [Styela clava]
MKSKLQQRNKSWTKLAKRTWAFVASLCLLAIPLSAGARIHQTSDAREEGKLKIDDTSLRGGRKLHDVSGLVEFQIALKKMIEEYKQLQHELEYCKSTMSTGGTTTDSSRQRPHSYDDVVSDQDERDIDIGERNYYGWMPFGK